MVSKNFRTRVIIGMLLENRGIDADSVSAAELLEAELLADAYIAKNMPPPPPLPALAGLRKLS